MFKKLRNWFRFYISIPTLLVYLFVLALFWRPLAQVLFYFSNWIAIQLSPPKWVTDISLGIVSDFLAGIIIGFALIVFLRKRRLHNMTGKFHAYLTTRGMNQKWGTVTLAYELLESSAEGPRIRLEIENEGIILRGEATIYRDQFLIGYYQEMSQLSRRRAGSFMLEMDGNGNYAGKFLFLSPDYKSPTMGTVRWKRIE